MLKQLKKYILIGLCIALLHSTLLSSAINTTEQQIAPKAENAQHIHDENQSEENQKKKPSILTSWQKVITLEWKTLTKTDAWNISKSITAIGIAGLFYRYFAKEGNDTISADNPDLRPDPNLFNRNAANLNNANDTKTNPTKLFNDNFSNSTDSDTETDDSSASESNPSIENSAKFFNDSSSSDTDSDTETSDNSSSSERDSSSEGLYSVIASHCFLDNLNSNPICIPQTNNIISLAPSEPIRHRNPACFFDYDVLPDDPQHLIALYMISDVFVPSTPIQNKNKTFSIAISPDNTRIVSATLGNNATIWSPYNQGFYILKGHTKLILSIAISPNNAYVITGSCDNTAKVWDMYTGQLKHTCIGHAAPINFITISADNTYATTCSQDMIVKTWNIETGQLLQTAEGYNHYCNSLVAYCTNKVNMLPGPTKDTTNLMSVITFKIEHTIKEPTKTIHSVAISQNHAYVVLGLSNDTSKITPLQLNLEEQESLTFTWIKNNILPCHAHLIIRAFATTQAKDVFIINSGSDNAMVWITFPAYVRYYLRSRLNIQLKK